MAAEISGDSELGSRDGVGITERHTIQHSIEDPIEHSIEDPIEQWI